MGCACQHNAAPTGLTRGAIINIDPTRTLTLRNRFVREMNRRFNALAKVVWESVVTNDAFGLNEDTPPRGLFQAAARPGQFAYPRSADKVQEFMDWLHEQNQEYILSGGRQGIRSIREGGLTGTGGVGWTDVYIQSAYQQGIKRGRVELRRAGVVIPEFDNTLGQDDLQFAFNQPFHADAVGLLFTRTFSELKGITAAMEQQVSRVLAQGMAEGRNPREIGEILNKVITGMGGDLGITDTLGRYIPAKRRAEILARTEIIRAHHMAMMYEYKAAQVEGVYVKAEWSTAGDGRVCPICRPMEGRVFTIDAIMSMIPAHPQCRCIALPWLRPTEEE